MKRLFTILSILSFLLSTQILAQTLLQRTALVRDPSQLEQGFGGVVAGVDFDNDGLPEIYACNSNFIDGPYELKPRLYKFEWNPVQAKWDSVWGYVSDIPQQNTWPGLTWGDLDKDGRKEIIWGPVNFLDAQLNPNPPRIVVFEYPGDGSNNMGVSDGFGGFLPNAKTSIVNENMFELRPIRFVIADIDNDNTDEIIFADRRAANGNFHIGVISVNTIPNDGSGLEVWTTKFSGVGDFVLAGTGNKWDLTVVPPYIGLWGNAGETYLVKYTPQGYVVNPAQNTVADKLGSFKGSVVANYNGNKEAFVGAWFAGAKAYYLKKDQNADSLLSYQIADFNVFDQNPATALRLNGADAGDIDNDGKLDLVFGTRGGTSEPNAMIFRLEHQGGDLTNAANYVATVIDSAIIPVGGDYDVIVVANVDGDPAHEVLYTQGYSRANPTDEFVPIVILDVQFTPVSVERIEDFIPANIYLEQNYPNPFNPTTNIKFGITKAANVDLRVYDMLGREVAVLVDNQFMEAGNYSTKFSAEKLASGIYLYKLKAGEFELTKKMQLIK